MMQLVVWAINTDQDARLIVLNNGISQKELRIISSN